MTVRQTTHKVRRAGPPIFAFPSPRPPLGGFTIEMHSSRADSRRLLWLPANTAGSKVRGRAAPATLRGFTKETLWDHQRVPCRFLRSHPRRIGLGRRARRDPAAAAPTYHGWSPRPLKTGTFYFAGKRNFRLCLDTFGHNAGTFARGLKYTAIIPV